VGGDEIFQHGKAFLKVGENGVFNDLTTFSARFLGLGHQTTHTRQLSDLFFGTTSTGIQHHIDRVETLVIAFQLTHENIGQLGIDRAPNIDDLIVTFVVGNGTHGVFHHDVVNFFVPFLNQGFLFCGNNHVFQVKRKTTLEGHVVTKVLDIIEELGCSGYPTRGDYPTNDIPEGFLGENFVDVTHFFGYELIDHDTTDRCLNHVVNGLSVNRSVVNTHVHLGMQGYLTFVIGDGRFFG